MGADLHTIALFSTVRGLMCILSNMWMPKLSDRRGRKLVIIVSLIGDGVAYAVQGFAGHVAEGRVAVFLIGRAMSGFFGGSTPVLRAYVAEISMPDRQLLKQRMTLLMVSSQIAGIALAPLSGALATFGLTLPFFSCSGMAVFGVFGTICFFKEAAQLKAMQQKSSPSLEDHGKALVPEQVISPSADTDKVGSPETPKKKKNPWCDLVVILLTFAYSSLFLLVSGYILLLPVLLSNVSFGLHGETVEETEGNIARAFGFCAIPNGVCNILVSVFLFVPMTKQFGDLRVLIISGIIASANFVVYGFWPSELWHLCVLQAISGCCFGFMMPALGPLMASYAGVHYPNQMAETQAIPVLGMNLSMAFGQNMMALIHEQFSMRVAWIVSGACVALYMVFFIFAFILVDRRSSEKSLSSEQQVKLEMGGSEIMARQLST